MCVSADTASFLQQNNLGALFSSLHGCGQSGTAPTNDGNICRNNFRVLTRAVFHSASLFTLCR